MNIENFDNIISKIKNSNLRGIKTQLELAPPNRAEQLNNKQDVNIRNASVVALIYPKNDMMHLTLILRTEYNGSHSGQVAFPGGKQESFDIDHWHTAIREMEEEIGVNKENVDLLKELTPLYIPVSKFQVYPFLARANKELTFNLQKSEVANLIEMPLDYLLFKSEIEEVMVNVNKKDSMTVPAFVYEGNIIWGATAMILSELKALFVDSIEL